jgi:probable H4MPT-linked C1 transfer pathway protein
VVARAYRDALFVDMGSTTTDIIPIRAGAVAARGYTDAERLAAGELVYAGLVRSLVFACTKRAPIAGSWTPLMNDDFANMADVYRILGVLPAGADLQATTDGREKTQDASRKRLARMVGRDADELDDAAWFDLAKWFAEQQLRDIVDASTQALSGVRLESNAPVIAAGVGGELLREFSRRLGRPHVHFGDVVGAAPSAREAAAQFAPAAAIAVLASSP